jgi:uncharacterized membrane protein YfcA
MAGLPLESVLWLVAAAILVGFAKTAVGGVGAVAVVIFAAVLPARASTGAILPLLIFGDLVAVAYYRRHADWSVLWRLLPGVLPGLLIGAWFLAVADDTVMRVTIAVLLLVMCAVQLWQRINARDYAAMSRPDPHGVTTICAGAAAGFATMAANAGGPVMTVYLIAAGLPMLQLLGTTAWFYLVVNLAKVPFSVGLGLVTPSSLLVDALLLPAMVGGAVIGVLLVRRVRQRHFELVALAFSAGSALLLL